MAFFVVCCFAFPLKGNLTTEVDRTVSTHLLRRRPSSSVAVLLPFKEEPDQLGQRHCRCTSIAVMAFFVGCCFAFLLKGNRITEVDRTVSMHLLRRWPSSFGCCLTAFILTGNQTSRCLSVATMAFYVGRCFAIMKIIPIIILMKRHYLTRVKLTALHKNHIHIHVNKQNLKCNILSST